MRKEDLPEEEGQTTAANQSITMSARILGELADSSVPLGVSELGRRLGLSKTRVFRHLATLKQVGLVSQESVGDNYSLGWNVYRLGVAAAERFDLTRVAMRHMTKLRDGVQETVALAVSAGGDALVIGSAPSERPISISIKHGVVTPANGSALGRVILAFSPEEVQRRFLARIPKSSNPYAIADAVVMERRLAMTRENWWELSFNENVHGIAAIAAPVFDAQEKILAAVAVVGSAFSVTATPKAELVEAVQHCAAQISAEFNSKSWAQRNASLKK